MLKSGSPVLATVLVSIFAFGGQANVPSACGKDFRVENKVFSGNRKEPVSRSTTLFLNGVVYDYLDDPDEVIVFDKAEGRFVLLGMDRKVRSELTTQEVQALTNRLRQIASNQPDPFVRFLADPNFSQQYDSASGELVLASSWMTYRVVLAVAESPTVAQQYREFSDWYARLSSLLNPGSKPPAARLAVNEALARRNAIAREVYLTLSPKKGFPTTRIEIRSEHQLTPEVGAEDTVRVGQTRQFMDIFLPVSFEKYLDMMYR